MAEKTDLRILRIVMADPAGNRTAIVRTFVPAPLRARTAAEIMQIRSLHAEQVGFETTPLAGGAGRLEMMGGEFCGNATMSLAALRAYEEGLVEGEEKIYPLEISGADKLLDCRIVCRDNGYVGSVGMPLPEKMSARVYL